MMKKLAALIFALALIVPIAEARSHGSSHRSSSRSARTQHVSGYKTKKGKTVRPYKRRPPN
jgi:hypothetical protein